MEDSNSTFIGNVPLGWHLFFNQECYSKVVQDLNFLDGPCMQLLYSKILSYLIIIISSLFVKTPQIYKILKNESAQGISCLSQALNLIPISGNVTYSVAKGFPASAWADSGVLSIQVLFTVLLILLYSGHQRAAVVFLASYLGIMMFLLSPLSPMWVHVAQQVLSMPVLAVSKIIQIWTNFKNSNTGQLSAATIYMQQFRSLGRLFTSVTELGDPYRIAVYAQSSALNFILSGQMVYYNKNVESKKKQN